MAADIRPARESDVDALLAIETAAFVTDRLRRASIRRLIDGPTADVLVAELGDRVAGYCIVLFRSTARSARLYSIATAAELAGRGIGRGLLEAAEREATRRGKHSLRLEVREDNGRAIAFYEKAGYQRIGIRRGFYADGMTAIRLEKYLTGHAAAERTGGREATFGDSASLSRAMHKTPRPAAR